MADRKPAILFDGLNVLYRCAYAMMPGGLSVVLDGEETHTGAAYRMLRTIVEVHSTEPAAVPVVVWDADLSRATLRRHKMDKSYKAGRAPKNELDLDFHREVHDQRRLLNKLLARVGCFQAVAGEGWEADDVIANLAKRLSKRGSVLIVSNDRDMLSLLDFDGVRILNIGSRRHSQPGELYDYRDREWFQEKYSDVEPSQWIEMRALMGDSSDGIKGVAGIGEVWAYKLIRAYGTALDVIAFAEEIEKNGVTEVGHLAGPLVKANAVRKKLVGQQVTVKKARKLIELNYRAPFEWVERDVDRRVALREIRKLRFKSFLAGTLRTQLSEMLDACAA